jgi:hypothetical protein
MRPPGSCLHQRETYNFSVPVGERRLLEPSELWPQGAAAVRQGRRGRAIGSGWRRPGEDDSARGREWGANREVRAQVLFQLLTGQGPKLVEAVVAVRLRGAQVVGRLNLGGWKPRCPLERGYVDRRDRLRPRPDGLTRPSRARSHMHRERAVTHQLLRLISGLLSRVNCRPLPRDSRPAREGLCQLLLRRLRMLRIGA